MQGVAPNRSTALSHLILSRGPDIPCLQVQPLKGGLLGLTNAF